MGKKDTHNLNDRETFLKFLDEQSAGNTASFDETDEFEKEALEGFIEAETAAEAHEMLQETDRKIAQRTIQKQKRGNRFIWLAAASILLLVVSGWFFISQFANKAEPTIALAETKEKVQPQSQTEMAIKTPDEAVTGKEERKSGGKNDPFTELKPLSYNTETTVNEKNAEKAEAEGEELVTKSVAAKEDQLTTVTGNDAGVAVDASAAGYSNSALSKEQDGVATKGAVDLKQPSVAYNSVAQQEIDEEKSNVKDKYKKTLAEVDVMPATVSRKAPAKDSVSFAWYAGDETAVQNEVLKYIAKNYQGQAITGKFKVKLLVRTDGSTTALEVIQITRNVCNNCNVLLKEALDQIKGWKPALSGGKPLNSEKELLLEFK